MHMYTDILKRRLKQ